MELLQNWQAELSRLFIAQERLSVLFPPTFVSYRPWLTSVCTPQKLEELVCYYVSISTEGRYAIIRRLW